MNNPYNIRFSSNSWLGKTGENSKGFESFKTEIFGIRAYLLLVLNYYFKYNLKTISGIINKFAPPNENDTGSYIGYCEQITGKKRNEVLQISDFKKLAIAQHRIENGSDLNLENLESAIKILPSYYKVLFLKKKTLL